MTKRTVYPTLAEAEAAATAANRAADERTAYGTEPVQGGYAVAVLEKVESGWSLREEEEGAIEDSEREVESVEAQACTKASDSLPCPQCGSTAAPVKRKPVRESPEWWDAGRRRARRAA